MSPRERNLVRISAVVVIGALAFNFLVPADGGASGKNLLPTAKAREQAEVAVRTINRLRTEQEAMQPRIQHMAFTTPPAEVVPHVVRTLQQIARRSKIQLREVRPLRPVALKSKEGYLVPLDVRFTAPFQPNVVQFLYHTESPNTRIVVSKFTISSADARRRSVDVQAQLSIYTRTEIAEPAGTSPRPRTPSSGSDQPGNEPGNQSGSRQSAQRPAERNGNV